ncbi:MAG: TfoX/Sxy family protein [Bacteroidetes bacterium]|nr:TfoX/Sxy family protein [Bacteroidota bacterium]
MMINEKLTQRVREALTDVPKVKEKKMFRGITFMVNGKMCVSVGDEELMCRIDPEIFDEALEKNGARPMIHGDRTMQGFVFVHESSIARKKDFDYWINLSLSFNKKAKASKKKK